MPALWRAFLFPNQECSLQERSMMDRPEPPGDPVPIAPPVPGKTDPLPPEMPVPNPTPEIMPPPPPHPPTPPT
jgi:hypothetical protein